MAQNLLPVGSLVGDRWQVEEKIGRGGFGEIYRCTDTRDNKVVALKLIPKKIKNKSVPNLYDEARTLRAVQGRKFFTRYHSYGQTLLFDFLVMELIGSNLKSLKKSMPEKKFSVYTTLSMARMMLKAIEWLHEAGYLHRDIKSSNFAMGIEEKAGRVYLIDFGLSKRYVSDNGELRPLKNKVLFRGTYRYASANVLNGKDAGRRDDLISLFYTLIELSIRKLPWRKMTCCKKLAALKNSYDHSKLLGDFPPEFLQFFQHVKGLDAVQEPDYGLLLSILNSCLDKCSAAMPNSAYVGNDNIIQGIHYLSENSISLTMSTETTITGDILAYDEEESQDLVSSSD